MQRFNLFMLPFLDRIRNKASLFMGVRLMVVRLLENLKGFVDGFSLRVGVGMWHSEILPLSKRKKPLMTKGFFINNRRLAPVFDVQAKGA